MGDVDCAAEEVSEVAGLYRDIEAQTGSSLLRTPQRID